MNREEHHATFDALVSEIRACTACNLHRGRTQAVPGSGNINADIMFVGEAPGFYGMCDEKNFGFNAKIKSEALSKFVDTKFDLLINYCNPELLFPKVIMLKSKAQLKAGFDAESNFFNDISVKTPGNDIDTFNAELVKYLQILKLID